MIFVKILILILVFGSSFSIGKLIAGKYINRVKELKEMKSALNIFETKIKFTYESVPEIFEQIGNQMEGNIGSVFKESSKKMKDVSAGEAWIQSIEKTESNLNKEDKEILKKLGKLLGRIDADGQISEIELVSNFLDTQIDIAENERNKNEKMYKTLGGIIGLTLVIIFILNYMKG